MVLGRVEVNGVDTRRALHEVREDVVAGTGDSEDDVVGAEVK